MENKIRIPNDIREEILREANSFPVDSDRIGDLLTEMALACRYVAGQTWAGALELMADSEMSNSEVTPGLRAAVRILRGEE